MVDTERDAVMHHCVTRHSDGFEMDLRHGGNRKRTAQEGLVGIVLTDHYQIKLTRNVLRKCQRVGHLSFQVNTSVRSWASIRKGHGQSRRLVDERLEVSVFAFFHNLKNLMILRLRSKMIPCIKTISRQQ